MSTTTNPKTIAFRGVWTALATPFDAEKHVEVAAFEKLVEKQLAAGVHGLVISGTTGEGPTLDVQEKLSLIRKTRAMVGSASVGIMAGTGGSDTRTSVELSRLAEEAGADSLLVSTPPYNKPGIEGLKAHFHAIRKACKLPICLYHVPGRTAQFVPYKDLCEVLKDCRIEALKEASADMIYVDQILEHSKTRVLSGDDFTYLPALALGASGIISVASNLAPKACLRLFEHMQAGRLEQARKIHAELRRLNQLLFVESNPSPLKAFLAELGIAQDETRLPLTPVNSEHRQMIATFVRENKELFS